MPMMVVRADSLGKTGYETPAELDADTALLARVERMRRTAGELMGMGDVSGDGRPQGLPRSAPEEPSRCLVALPRTDSNTPGARCDRRDRVASTAVAPGTVASEVARIDVASKRLVVAVEHPAGQIEVTLEIHPAADGIDVVSAGLVRTARVIFDGTIYVPGTALEPRQVGDDSPSAPRPDTRNCEPKPTPGARTQAASRRSRDCVGNHGYRAPKVTASVPRCRARWQRPAIPRGRCMDQGGRIAKHLVT